MISQLEQDINRKIAVEQNIIQGARNLRQKTNNVMVIQKCNTNIREALQNIAYLEETLKKLQMNEQQSGGNSAQDTRFSSKGKEYGTLSTISPDEHVFSRLDLIKYDCPSMAQRIQYMLQQLEFKLRVEEQYQEANTKLTKLYQIDGDERSSSAAEGGAMESKYKIQLLRKALKKYQAINVDIDQYKHPDPDPLNNPTPKFRRKPLTGILSVSVNSIRDVDHVQSPAFAKSPETYIEFKIDDVVQAKTKPSRNDRWNDEFKISVDKGNEVEITVYDRINNVTMPVAVMWLLLSDIAEDIRKKKVSTATGQRWVSASTIENKSEQKTSIVSGNSYSTTGNSSGGSTTLVQPSDETSSGNDATTSTVDALKITTTHWFILEPAGQILVTLGFHKSSQPQRPNAMRGLHRNGAIINRKEEVYEQHGHHFVPKSFYNIMCCVYCGDFLRYSGFQCEDCRMVCHKKCYTNIVTRCVANTSKEKYPEAELNHRIPHRFEPFTNRGTKWCAQCGYILPWGKQKVRKCTECGVMCHAQCAPMVPAICGMSMEMANKILRAIQDAQRDQERRRRGLATSPGGSTSPYKTVSPNKRHSRFAPIENLFSGKQSPSTIGSDKSSSPQSRLSSSRVPQLSPEKQGNITPTKQSNYPSPNNAYLGSGDIVTQQQSSPEALAFDNTTEHYHKSPQQKVEMPQSPAKLNLTDLGIPQDVHPQIDRPPAEYPEWNGDRRELEIELSREPETSRSPQRLYEHQNVMLDTTSDLRPYDGRGSPGYDMSGIDVISQRERISFESEFTSTTDNSHLGRGTLEPSDIAGERMELTPHKFLTQGTTDSTVSAGPSRTSLYSISPQKSHGTPTKHRKKVSKRRKVSLDNFTLLKVLGKGNFGKVILSKSKNTGALCAIKVLKKDNIIQNHDIESARAEKKVFLLATKTQHPFLTNLYCSFQTENRIYFAMEFIGGGDLMWHVQNQRLSVRRAKFYAAEVLLALKFFHDNGIVYRDLKLENILLTPEGHIKIADYGLCKDEMWYGNKTSTFCGTPEFMAPEILKDQEYTRAVDWWAFGVLLYQMLLCQSPFSGDDEDEVFNAILTDEPLYPIDMAGDIVQIFQGLLTKDPENRLGAGPRDALEVMEEPFFRNINFDDILHLRVQPPYIPEIKSAEDTSYFEQEFTSAPPTLTPLPSVLTTSQQEEFRGFSYMPENLEL